MFTKLQVWIDKKYADKCPSCGEPLPYSNCYCSKCNYSSPIIMCSKCASIVENITLKERRFALEGRKKEITESTSRFCDCNAVYQEIGISYLEYAKLISSLKPKNYDELEDRERYYAYQIAEDAAHRHIYETCFDKSHINKNCKNFQKNYAHMYPHTPESRAYFQKYLQYESYEALYHPEPRRAFASDYEVPRCPICRSSRLIKLPTYDENDMLASFGLINEEDKGKIYQCKACKHKF